jgi:hypothetical protein
MSVRAAAPVIDGSSWLHGTGVNACAPGIDTTCGGQTHIGGIGTNWWQCVELAQRLYYLRGWYTANNGIFSGISYAYQIYDNASSLGMSRQANGSVASVVPGDMIVHTSADGGGAGHVAVVDSIVGGNVNVVEQNFNGTAETAAYTLSGSTLSRGSMHIAGVVHSPNNPNTNANPYTGVGNATFKGVTQLTTNMKLNPNEYITSLNGQSVLIMQTDGNLVMYSGSSTARWSSGTNGHPGAYLIVQPDGNVVVYAPNGQPLWWTGTNSVTRFTMQTDGNLVGYDINNQWKWQSNTGGQPAWTYKETDHLNQYQRLNPGEYLKSTDKRYFLLMQPDGNLVLYSPGYHVLWNSGTGGNAGAYLGVQGDGNIVVYRADGWPLWFTGTNNAFDLFVQNDGNLVAYTLTNSWVWQSWTGGRI